MEQFDIDILVESVTNEIMRRLTQIERQRVLVIDGDEKCDIAGTLGAKYETVIKPVLQDVDAYDYIVLPTANLRQIIEGDKVNRLGALSHTENAAIGADRTLDLRNKRLVHERELRARCTPNVTRLVLGKGTIITQLALDFIKEGNLTIAWTEQ